MTRCSPRQKNRIEPLALKSKRYFGPFKDGRAVEEGNDAGFDWRRVMVADQSRRDDGIASVVERNGKG